MCRRGPAEHHIHQASGYLCRSVQVRNQGVQLRCALLVSTAVHSALLLLLQMPPGASTVKTAEQRQMILSAVQKNVLFENLDSNQQVRATCCLGVQPFAIATARNCGHHVAATGASRHFHHQTGLVELLTISQPNCCFRAGELGDNFYVVADGSFDIFVSREGKAAVRVATRGA